MKTVINLELTDTFGGELNYSWVKRHKIEADKNLTNRAILKIAREVFELGNVKLNKQYNDVYKLSGCCIALTINEG